MPAQHNSVPEIRPQSLLFEITPRCNLNCRYCYNVWKDDCGYPVGELDTKDVKRLLRKAVDESGVSQVTITGGEPFLREDLVEIIRFLSDMDIAVGLIANGAAGDESTYREAVRAGAGIVELPLQSSERDIHNRMVRGDAFDRATERLVDVKAAGGSTCAVIVLTRMNIHDVRETIKMAAVLGADSVMINRFNVGGEGRNHIDELLPTPDELADALLEAEAAGDEWKLPVFSSVPVQPCLVDHTKFKNMPFGHCPACTDKGYYTIGPLGNLRPCNHSPTILGNLFDNDFQTLAGNGRAAAFRTAVPGFCTDCVVADECRGGCKAAGEACTGCTSSEDPFLARHQDTAQLGKKRLNQQSKENRQ